MKSKAPYSIFGSILCLLAAGFAAVALTHPELSFPWKNWVSYTLYALYAIYTILIFCMPKCKSASLLTCVIVGLQLLSLALIVIYIGTRRTPHESSWYLIAGLVLTCVTSFTTIAITKKNTR